MSTDEGVHTFADLTEMLHAYNTSNEKYVNSQAATAMIMGLATCDDETFPDTEKTPSVNIDRLFNESARNLVNEILEYRAELKQRDYIEESSVSALSGDRTDSQSQTEKLQEMQDELARIKEELEEVESEEAKVDMELLEANETHDQALAELKITSAVNRTGVAPTAAYSNVAAGSLECSEGSTSACALKQTESNLEALLSGLQFLFRVRVQSIEWAIESVDSGVLLGISIGQNDYTFELDYSNKLIDIQAKSGVPPCSVDTVKLLCECAQLEAPQDLRHAVFVLGAVTRCKDALRDHLRSVRKTCLVDVHPADFRRIEITLANGVCAVFRVHECYPQVPNGVHTESVSGVGGWAQVELDAARAVVNARCPKTIPDAVNSLVDALTER